MDKAKLGKAAEAATLLATMTGGAVLSALWTASTGTPGDLCLLPLAQSAAACLTGGLAGNLLKDAYGTLNERFLKRPAEIYALEQNHHVWAAFKTAKIDSVKEILALYKTREFAPKKGSFDAEYVNLLEKYLEEERKRPPSGPIDVQLHADVVRSTAEAAVTAMQAAQTPPHPSAPPAEVDAELHNRYHACAQALRKAAEAAVLSELLEGVDSMRVTPIVHEDHPATFKRLFVGERGWFPRFFGKVIAKLKDPKEQAFRIAHDEAMAARTQQDVFIVRTQVEATIDKLGEISDALAKQSRWLNQFASIPLRRREHRQNENLLRLSFWNPDIPFVGREEQIAEIVEFMNVRDETGACKPFHWWLVTGGGGAGKSRLALEICDRCSLGEISVDGKLWDAAFLDMPKKLDFAIAKMWQPEQPTLVVIDYVLRDAQEIRELIRALHNRPPSDALVNPIRFLLLEREDGFAFKKDFVTYQTTLSEGITGSRYRETSLELSDPDPDMLWRIFKGYVMSGAKDGQCPISEKDFLTQLHRIDPKRRPLSALLLADSTLSGADFGKFANLHELLNNLLQRERSRWPHDGSHTPLVREEVEEPALALANMVHGIRRSHYTRLPADTQNFLSGVKTAPLEHLGLAHDGGQEDVVVGWMEPDLIGEFFSLHVAGKKACFSEARSVQWLPGAAWRADAAQMLDFVRRARQNFADGLPASEIEGGLSACGEPVAGIVESFIALTERKLAENLSEPDASLADAIDKATEHLRPYILSDFAAAEAFGELVILAAAEVELP